VTAWRYIYLLSSLPALPPLATARALPIGEQRLKARLSLLTPSDSATLDEALELLAWPRQQPLQSDAEAVARFLAAAEKHPLPALREIASSRLEMRLIVAALRYRRAGMTQLPEALARTSPLGARLQRHFHEPEFGLTAAAPWIGNARRHMDGADWPALETLLLSRSWAALTSLDSRHRYAFENVLAYVLRWEILARRLNADTEHAAAVFAALVEEALDERLAAFA
jgi:hypothetical protein